MKFGRDAWLAAGVIVLLVLLTIAAAVQKAPVVPYLSTSSSADGTLALKLWLRALGYQVSDQSLATYQPPQDTDLILILQPVLKITDSEWQVIDQRVMNGAMLILAGDNLPSGDALQHLGFSLVPFDQPPASLSAQTPLLTSPPITSTISVPSDFGLAPERSHFVVQLASNGQPVLASFDEGQGVVIVAATPYLFSNLALKDETTAALVLNLIGLSAHHRSAWFDDWHHGVQGSNSIIGPDEWLRGTPLGNALLFVVGVVFLALFLQGGAFGRPVPVPSEVRRRGPMEHVTAIANLNRKAGNRDAVVGQYHTRLKRQLARRYSLDPFLSDEEYVRSLAQYNAAIDQRALLELLRGLSQKHIGEAEMVRLTAQASKWIDDQP